MRLFKHWKLILGLCVIFTAGAVSGVVGTLHQVKKVVSERTSPKWWIHARLKELDKRLQLTPEQRSKIKPKIEDAGLEFQQIAGDAMGEVVRLVEKTHEAVAEDLRPEQLAELRKVEAEAKQRWLEMMSPKDKEKNKASARSN